MQVLLPPTAVEEVAPVGHMHIHAHEINGRVGQATS